MTVYDFVLNQENIIHKNELHFPFEERGLQFGDGVYEVIRVYNGNSYLLNQHIDRLYKSLSRIKLDINYTKLGLISKLSLLLKRNNVEVDSIIYLQVTRGSAPRKHSFPLKSKPNLYAYVEKMPRNLAAFENGIKAITYPDERWSNCYIKSLNLLPNVLAKQTAESKGCSEAILHKSKIITEGSSSNVFLVKNDNIYTHPATRNILEGCVRNLVKRFSYNLNITFNENLFSITNLYQADELFLTSSTMEVTPIVKVDGVVIARGSPGTITRKLQKEYCSDAKIDFFV